MAFFQCAEGLKFIYLFPALHNDCPDLNDFLVSAVLPEIIKGIELGIQIGSCLRGFPTTSASPRRILFLCRI